MRFICTVIAAGAFFSGAGALIACGDDSAGPASSDAGENDANDAAQTDGTVVAPMDSGESDAGFDAGSYDAGPPAVRYIGRFTSEAVPRASWPGTRATVRFQGTALTAALSESASGTSEYDVTIDGKVQATPIIMLPATTSYAIATALPNGIHVIDLMKRSESYDGVEGFAGFTFGDGGVLLPPPMPGAHKIEFVGDSVTAGYGIEGTEPCTGNSQNTNVREAYANQAAILLDSDAVFIAYSGKGVTRNYDHTDTDMLSDLYLRTLESEATTWDFTRFVPDAIVIALGANDYTNDNNMFPTGVAFGTAYQALITRIRGKNPQAKIFAMITPSMTDPGYTTANTAIGTAVAALTSAGDKAVFQFASVPVSTATDVTGCQEHPNIAYDAKTAKGLAAFIKQKTGW